MVSIRTTTILFYNSYHRLWVRDNNSFSYRCISVPPLQPQAPSSYWKLLWQYMNKQHHGETFDQGWGNQTLARAGATGYSDRISCKCYFRHTQIPGVAEDYSLFPGLTLNVWNQYAGWSSLHSNILEASAHTCHIWTATRCTYMCSTYQSLLLNLTKLLAWLGTNRIINIQCAASLAHNSKQTCKWYHTSVRYPSSYKYVKSHFFADT